MTTPGPEEEDRPSRATLAARAATFEHALRNQMASTVRRLPFGVARFVPELPKVHDLSGIEVDRPVAHHELTATLRGAYAGWPHHRVRTARAEVAWSVGPALAERGWDVEVCVDMVHDPDAALRVSPIGFRQVDARTYQTFNAAFTAEQPWGKDPEVVTQMAGRDALLEERVGARFVMAGDAAAGCHVYRHGAIAQIENVGVLTEARGRGLGTGLMAAALRACGDATTVFLSADATGWPRTWYGRLGFTDVGSSWSWGRDTDG